MRFLTISAILSLSLLGLNCLSAGVWVRGSAVALESSGEVQIAVPTSGLTYESFDQPKYFPGIFSCRAQPGGEVLIQMSNQMRLAFQGEGFFSVERVESLFADNQAADASLEAARDRMILNLRRGALIIDSRELSEASRLVLETPFGRITGVKNVLLVQIEFDHRSGIYDFTISSVEGIARLHDHRGQSYEIYPGQRISGAGSYLAPAIEVGEQMNEIVEEFQAYFKTLEKLDPERVDPEQLQAHLKVLPRLENTATAARLSAEASGGTIRKRPRIIEYAPAAKPITPFRAEVKPPSDFQADLF